MIDISQKHIDKRIYIHHPITRMETKLVQVKETNSVLLMFSTQAVHVDPGCASGTHSLVQLLLTTVCG